MGKAPITMNHDDSNVSVKPVCLPFKTNCKNLAGCRPRSTLPCPCENGPDAFETTPKNRGKEALVAGWGKTAFYKNSTQFRNFAEIIRSCDKSKNLSAVRSEQCCSLLKIHLCRGQRGKGLMSG